MKIFVLAAATVGLATATPAKASPEISGEAGLVSTYITLDGFDYSDGPAAQASLDISFGKCGVSFWGSKTLGSKLGDEFDSTLHCSHSLGEKTEVSVAVSHYAFAGPNMIVFNGNIAHDIAVGSVDIDITQYTWSQNQDATQVQVGFAPNISETVSLRGVVTYETGFDLPDIVMAGVEASYQVHKHLSLRATALMPLHRRHGDPRNARFVVSAFITF